MHINFTPFQDWLTYQYPHSSARKHYLSDLVLFFSWAGKPLSEISPQDVDTYIHHCLEKSLSPLTINRGLSSLRLFYLSQLMGAISLPARPTRRNFSINSCWSLNVKPTSSI